MNNKFAIVFPGQGSQSLGMLSELAENYEIVKSTFAEASSVLGYDLWDLVQNDPEEKLNQTQYTQPALLVAGVAVWRALNEVYPGKISPDCIAGHSLGEYTAMVCAGVIDFKDGVKLVAERGRLMQEAVPQGKGAMAAIIGLDDDKVSELCASVANGEDLQPANYNAVGQVVIAGTKSAVERAVADAKPFGAKLAKVLAVSVPAHSSMMKPASEKFKVFLERTQFDSPKFPIIQNVDVESHTSPEIIRARLIEQLYSPVRWVETVQSMKEQGVTKIIECGPGKVLSGLVKRIDRDIETTSVSDTEQVKSLGEWL